MAMEKIRAPQGHLCHQTQELLFEGVAFWLPSNRKNRKGLIIGEGCSWNWVLALGGGRGKTPAAGADANTVTDNGLSALVVAAVNGHTAVVKQVPSFE